jgi:hypothetical protein
LPTFTIRTKLNDFDASDNTAYPYIYIGEVYQNEDGPKNYYRYPVEILLQIVYKDQTSLTPLYGTQNTVLGLLTGPFDLTLTNNFQLLDTELIMSNDSEIKIDSGTLNIGMIRIRFTIWDKQ